MIRTILVVDDEPALLDALVAYLSEEGYDVRAAANGAEALERWQCQPTDLVITDSTMPVCDGLALIAELRTQAHPPAMILMSGSLRPWGLPLGVGWVAKPFEVDELLTVIALINNPLRRMPLDEMSL